LHFDLFFVFFLSFSFFFFLKKFSFFFKKKTAFSTLHRHVGRAVVDEILPPLLKELNSEDSEVATKALEVTFKKQRKRRKKEKNRKKFFFEKKGLKAMTSVKSVVVFPILIEHLLHPITPSNAKGLFLFLFFFFFPFLPFLSI